MSVSVQIKAPLLGITLPLEQINDQVFSKKMAGDGLAIDPVSNLLVAPIDGVVTFIHSSKHALTLKSDTHPNLEILIHIGLDTVALKGEGFKSFVNVNQKVKKGDHLIEFDLDLISRKAKSPHTILLVTDLTQNKISFNSIAKGLIETLDTNLLEVTPAAQSDVLNSNENFNFDTGINLSAQAESTKEGDVVPEKASTTLSCQIPSGLHARPSSVISQMTAKYPHHQFQISKDTGLANAKSVTSLMSLGINFGDSITVTVIGENSTPVLQKVVELFNELSKEHGSPSTTKPKAQTEKMIPNTDPASYANTSQVNTKNEYSGILASPGNVYGKIKQFKTTEIKISQNTESIQPANEIERLKGALAKTTVRIENSIQQAGAKDSEQTSIYKAHLELLNDPEIYTHAEGLITSGFSAEYAWQTAIEQIKSTLKALNNEVMSERANDVHDVGQQVLRSLLNISEQKPLNLEGLTEPVILVARNLTPSDMNHIDPKIVHGLVLIEGGASSHVSIIARSLNIASITAAQESVLRLTEGQPAILYAKKGRLKIHPTTEEIQDIVESAKKIEKINTENLQQSKSPAITLDGAHIDVFANIGKNSESKLALTSGAEGVGLLRSEFLFLDRETAPTEQEQIQEYQNILSSFNSDKQRTVIIRTLDVGGDKPLAYLPISAEENPFLGLRGLRLSLQHLDLFKTQIRALLQVNPQDSLKIMFPMVTTLSELLAAKKIVQEECQKLKVDLPSLGIMIEVPSAALMAEVLAPHVDFFSIGSNDLTQYVLAIDRGHKDLAVMADGLHPSILKLIKITCEAAQKHKKMVGVCGGIASDVQAVPLLIGLGVQELSVSVPSIPQVKALIRKLNFSDCQKIALKALEMNEASEIRTWVDQNIKESF